jgi:hypothetical protein
VHTNALCLMSTSVSYSVQCPYKTRLWRQSPGGMIITASAEVVKTAFVSVWRHLTANGHTRAYVTPRFVWCRQEGATTKDMQKIYQKPIRSVFYAAQEFQKL